MNDETQSDRSAAWLKLNVYPPSFFNRPEEYAKIAAEEVTYKKIYRRLQAQFEIEKKTKEFQEHYELQAECMRVFLWDLDYFGLGAEECVKKFTDAYFEFFYLDQVALFTAMNAPDLHEVIEVVDKVNFEALTKKGPVVFAVAHNGPHQIVPSYLAAHGKPIIFTGGLGPQLMNGFQNMFDTFKYKAGASYVAFDDRFYENCKEKMKSGANLFIYPEYSRSQRVGTLTTDFFNDQIHVPCGALRLGNQFNLPVVLVYLRKTATGYQLVYDSVYKPVSFKWLKGRKKVYAQIQQDSLELFNVIKSLIAEKPEYWEGWRYWNFIKENTIKAMMAQRGEGPEA